MLNIAVRTSCRLATKSSFGSCTGVVRNFASVGDKLPSVELYKGFPEVERVNIAERCKSKSVIILGLPGAFTPTCSNTQIPNYLENQDVLKEKGVDEVIVLSVNDSAVMQAWAKDQEAGDSMLTFLGDPASELTRALDLELTDPGPKSKGLFGRCKRFAIHVEDSVINAIQISEAPDDPAGDSNPSETLVEGILGAMDSK